MPNEPTIIAPTLAHAIAKLIFDQIDPQTDSQVDDCLDIAREHFADSTIPGMLDAIIAELWRIIDSDPH